MYACTYCACTHAQCLITIAARRDAVKMTSCSGNSRQIGMKTATLFIGVLLTKGAADWGSESNTAGTTDLLTEVLHRVPPYELLWPEEVDLGSAGALKRGSITAQLAGICVGSSATAGGAVACYKDVIGQLLASGDIGLEQMSGSVANDGQRAEVQWSPAPAIPDHDESRNATHVRAAADWGSESNTTDLPASSPPEEPAAEVFHRCILGHVVLLCSESSSSHVCITQPL